MNLEFVQRLNLITGDNGLGKSFLLDIAWWAMPRNWPAEINPRLTSGKTALPSKEGIAEIGFSFTGRSRTEDYVFDQRLAAQQLARHVSDKLCDRTLDLTHQSCGAPLASA